MWIWIWDLRQQGFKQKSDRYFQCKHGFGLQPNQHLSLFLWTRNAKKQNATYFQLSEFHVTTQLGGHHLHFYFHENRENVWHSGGHTSEAEIARLGYHTLALRQDANEIAASFIESLGGNFIQKDTNPEL